MTREINECVGCPEGVPCIGDSCPLRHVERIYCDSCGADITGEKYIEDYSGDYCFKCAHSLNLIDNADDGDD